MVVKNCNEYDDDDDDDDGNRNGGNWMGIQYGNCRQSKQHSCQ